MSETKLQNQALGVSARLASKVVAFTRDMTAISGDVPYTGVGFTPSAIIVISAIATSKYWNIGMADSAKTGAAIVQYTTDTVTVDNFLIDQYVEVGNQQTAIVKSFDIDGFTLTWVKTGTPTGTLTMKFLCFR